MYISPCSNKNCSRQEEDEVEQKDNVFEHIVAKTHDEEPIWQKINLADDFVCVEKPVCNLLLLFFLYSESLNSYYYFGFFRFLRINHAGCSGATLRSDAQT